MVEGRGVTAWKRSRVEVESQSWSQMDRGGWMEGMGPSGHRFWPTRAEESVGEK